MATASHSHLDVSNGRGNAAPVYLVDDQQDRYYASHNPDAQAQPLRAHYLNEKKPSQRNALQILPLGSVFGKDLSLCPLLRS